MSGKLTFLWLVVAIGALVVGATLLAAQDRRTGVELPEYSVRRTDAKGAAAVFRLMQASGLRPAIWDRDLTRLSKPGMLIVLAQTPERKILGMTVAAGGHGEFLPHELEALDQWVQQGNVVVMMDRSANDLYRRLGLIVDEPEGISGISAQPVQPSVLAYGVNEIATQTQFGFKFGRAHATNPMSGQEEDEAPDLPSSLPLIPAEAWVTLFTKTDQSRSVPQVVTAVRGRGQYVAVNDVFPAGNTGISEKDDAQFMLDLARMVPRGGTIWFDEYHKRDVDAGLVAYFRDRSLLPAAVYFLLVLGLLFWRTGSPFGEVQPLRAAAAGSGVSYVRAAATLYQNARMWREATNTIVTDFRRRLTGALRMDGLTDLDEVARRYELRTGRPGREAREVLILMEASLARQRLTEAEALQVCSNISQLDQQLHAPKGR